MFVEIINNELVKYGSMEFPGATQEVDITIEEYQKDPLKWVVVDNKLVEDPDPAKSELERQREVKYQENVNIREKFLVSGVLYKGVLFDSDLEQKLNLSIATSTMSETDVMEWVGMDGTTSLECTKQDLLNIGQLLTIMTSYVWQQRNPEIKTLIANAKTLRELNSINIEYEMPEVIL